MRAAYYEENGPARIVLKIGERPIPEPGPGEVRVQVKVSGVNPSDVKTRRGSGRVPGFPLTIPHSDGACPFHLLDPGVALDRGHPPERSSPAALRESLCQGSHPRCNETEKHGSAGAAQRPQLRRKGAASEYALKSGSAQAANRS